VAKVAVQHPNDDPRRVNSHHHPGHVAGLGGTLDSRRLLHQGNAVAGIHRLAGASCRTIPYLLRPAGSTTLTTCGADGPGSGTGALAAPAGRTAGCGGPWIGRVGALASRAKLERRRYAEAGSRTHTDRTVSGHSASDLYGAVARIGRYGGGHRRVAGCAGRHLRAGRDPVEDSRRGGADAPDLCRVRAIPQRDRGTNTAALLRHCDRPLRDWFGAYRGVMAGSDEQCPPRPAQRQIATRRLPLPLALRESAAVPTDLHPRLAVGGDFGVA